jgi:hypothetical protein
VIQSEREANQRNLRGKPDAKEFARPTAKRSEGTEITESDTESTDARSLSLFLGNFERAAEEPADLATS